MHGGLQGLAGLTQFGVNTGGGYTDQYAREYLIRNVGRSTSLNDLRNLVVATAGNTAIYLRQVAEVEFAPKFKRGDAGYMGKPAVVVSVEKQPGIDTVVLTREIEQSLQETAGSLPPGMKADQILLRAIADYIKRLKSKFNDEDKEVRITGLWFILSLRAKKLTVDS